MDRPTFVYVTYIATSLEQLWDALTSEAFTQQYWGEGQLQSDWQVGATIQHINPDGEPDWQGEVLQSEPPHRLAYSFQPLDATENQPSHVQFELQQYGTLVKLTLIHNRLDAQSCLTISRKWTASLSHLKHLLEIADGLALVA
ncbi:ATPase [Leptolyngbya sp. NK1-12]|uniref:ATPase n=1 Tax=Leptolyngbya sp. NK1-12 TaxID=2547451 RepID=A0AA96WPX2_9CYAN|nr:ATPase [Leptolyngbya sp. NK1-12]